MLITAALVGVAMLLPGAAFADTNPKPISASSIVVPAGTETFNLNVQRNYPDLELTYYTAEGETAFTVDQEGNVTLLTDMPGMYSAYVYCARTEQTAAMTLQVFFFLDKKDQTVSGPSKVTGVFGKPVKVKATAQTPITYESRDTSVAKVNKTDGTVTFLHPGTVKIAAIAASSDVYKMNSLMITVTSKLGKPSLTVTAGTRKATLRWSKVPKAGKYLVYCKYPGSTKYKLVAKRLASVKGITHKNLKKGKNYSYKVRAYLKLNGKSYYGPYSKAVTVKIK